MARVWMILWLTWTSLTWTSLTWTWLTSTGSAAALELQVAQITQGPQHHFFGYIGQSLTTPWNASGRYIVSLRTTFHDRMPIAKDAADIVLIDTANQHRVSKVEQTRAWNFQQGTMFYWHPTKSETQFFFNDRDLHTNQIYTVLFDMASRRRVREYRFEDVPVANGGVAPTGEFFLAINYARMARLRPVTGYPETVDQTSLERAPSNDGIFRVDIDTGQRQLLVSFRQLRDLVANRYEAVDDVEFYINHSLCSRDARWVYFFARGKLGKQRLFVDVPCSVRTDGRDLRLHTYIGGHPEWDSGTRVIGARDGKQVLYDIQRQEIVGQIATPAILPKPGGDVALSADSNWFACGYSINERRQNQYVIFRKSDHAHARTPAFSRGAYRRGELRIDPAPRWNRDQSQLLVPGVVADGTRQLHIVRVKP